MKKLFFFFVASLQISFAQANVLRNCSPQELVKMGSVNLVNRPIDQGENIFDEIGLFNSLLGVISLDVCQSPNRSFFFLTQVVKIMDVVPEKKITIYTVLTSNNYGRN